MPKTVVLQPPQYDQQYGSNQAASVAGSLFLQLTLLAVVFLPFSKALTLPVGFPLKGYEILLPIAALLFFLKGKISGGKDIRRVMLWSIGFFIVTLASALAGQFDTTADTGLNYRGDRFADSMMRVAYLLFNIITLLVAYHVALKSPSKVLRFWFVGLFISFAYHFLTVLFFVFTGDAPLLPGLERHQVGWVGSILIPRSGTFEEGNFAGLYYLASLALAVYAGNKFMMAVAVGGVILTLSTSTYLALAVFLLAFWFVQKRTSLTNLLGIIFIVPLIVVALVQLDVVSKFGEDAGSSGAVRLNEAMTGIQIFLAHPFLGVGLGGYGFHFDAFEWDSALSIFFGSDKHIANNVYVELLSETGMAGFFLYVLIFLGWFSAIRNGDRKIICFSAFRFGMLVAFLAYPTFNITYIWFFIGLTTALARIDVGHSGHNS